MRIGDTVYICDVNSRVYTRPERGFGRAVHRGHFQEHRIVGETRVSWILDHVKGGRKLNKKLLHLGEIHGVARTVAEVDLLCWAEKASIKLPDLVRHARPEMLREIARVMGVTLDFEETDEELDALANWPGTWKEWAQEKLDDRGSRS